MYPTLLCHVWGVVKGACSTFENSNQNLTSSIRNEGRELRDVLILVGVAICCNALKMWCSVRVDVCCEGGGFSNVKCFRCLSFFCCVADINVHICSNLGSERTCPSFANLSPFFASLQWLFVCESCTGAYASANALHNHTRRFTVGSRCPPMTNDKNSMLSPLTWMPGRCVAIRVRRTFANEPLRTTCVINTRHPRSWCVGGTSAKMQLPQSADTTSLTGVVSSWRGRESATRCRHWLSQMVPLLLLLHWARPLPPGGGEDSGDAASLLFSFLSLLFSLSSFLFLLNNGPNTMF